MDQDKPTLAALWVPVTRWWWLIILGTVAPIIVAFFVSQAITPTYEATSRLLVQSAAIPGIPSANDIQVSKQLAQIYGDMIKTKSVMEPVVQKLALPYGPDGLSSKISVGSSSSLIEIRAKDPDPLLAASISNATSQVFIDYIRDRQLTQIAQFQNSLSQAGIAQDPSIISAQAATLSGLSILEEALPPGSPSSPQPVRNMILAGVLGLMVAGLLVFVLEHLDDRVKSTEDLKKLTGLVTLGSIPWHSNSDGLGPVTLKDVNQQGVMAESFKFLRTNLSLVALGANGFDSLLVTSAHRAEGKTLASINLAIAIAKGGKSVIMVDGDLRKPSLHKTFGLEGHKGLTDVLLGDTTLEEALAATEVEGLSVLPSGPVPPDPASILMASRMKEIVKQLQEQADIVIYDSPPVLAVSDALVLARLVDGVLLIVDAKHTGRNLVKRVSEDIRQADIGFAAAALNKIVPSRNSYYYDYYSGYYYASDHPRRFGRVSKRVRRSLAQTSRILPRSLGRNDRK